MPNPAKHPVVLRLRAAGASECGSATIESLLWLPIFIAFFALVADTAMVFNNRSLAIKLVQDTNRARAVGRLETDAAARAFLSDRIKAMSPTAKASVVTSPTTRIVTSSLQIPAHEIDAIGLFGRLAKIDVVVQAQHMMED